MENIEPQSSSPGEGVGLSKSERKYYKPWGLRSPALGLLLLLTLSLLAMTEFAFHALPKSNRHGIIEKRVISTLLVKPRSDNYVSTVTTTLVLRFLRLSLPNATIECARPCSQLGVQNTRIPGNTCNHVWTSFLRTRNYMCSTTSVLARSWNSYHTSPNHTTNNAKFKSKLRP